MGGKSGRRNHGRAIIEEIHGRKIVEEKSRSIICGGEILEDEPWRRNPGGEMVEE